MKVRIISAVVAIAILVPFIWVGGYPFAIMISILGFLGLKEIIDLKKSHKEIPLVMKIMAIISLASIMVGNYNQITPNYEFLLLPMLLLLLPTVFYKKDKYTTHDALYLLGSIFLLGFLFNLLIYLRNVNLYILLYLISVTIFTDTFAYIVGSLIGKHKMTVISPKKSWEGAVGGLIFGTIVALIIYGTLVNPINWKIIIITILLSAIGQIGDLFYSKIKRENDIKDFSNIMPGHGGILDRVDSLTFVLFAYILLTAIFRI